MNSNNRPVAVVIGATSKWQSDGRNTRLIHGEDIDDSHPVDDMIGGDDLPQNSIQARRFPLDIILYKNFYNAPP